jgi:predicted metalloendopeptidase
MLMKRFERLTRLCTGTPRLVALCALTIAGLGYAGTTPVEGIDPAVVPGDDFFTYANGAWLKATEIPADRSAYGAGSIVAELNLQRVAKLIEQAAHGSVSSQSRAIDDFYSSYMDEAAIEKRGITPLEGTLKRIAAITDRKMLARALGESLRSDVDVLNNTEVHTPNLFGVWIAADLNDPTRYVPFLVQGGLERRAPGLDWEAFFTAAHLNQVPDFIVWQPSALQGLSALVASEELDTWKDWLWFYRPHHRSRDQSQL